MKKVLAFVGSILLAGSMAVYAAPDASKNISKMDLTKIAVVNMQQVLQQSPKVAELSTKLQNQFKSRQQKLDAAQKSLQDELDKFKKDSATMADKDRDAMQKKITDDRASLVKDVVAFQQDLNKEQGKVMQGILGQLNDIISKVAKQNNYTLVLDAQAVVYATDAADITKQVSKAFNEK